MENKPYYYVTKHFVHTYHGGGFSPENLKVNRRGKINTFTRASMKRLSLKIDAFESFKPKWEIEIIYNDIPEWNTTKKTLNTFTNKLSLDRYSKRKPLWFWKKNILNGQLVIIIITNIETVFDEKILPFAIESFYMNISKNKIERITTKKIQDPDDIYLDFCFKNYVEIKNYPGKWWGVINAVYYKQKKQKKNICTLLEIEEIEILNSNKSIKTKEFKKNLYKN